MRRLDALVYKLYELTEEEIAVVGGGITEDTEGSDYTERLQ